MSITAIALSTLVFAPSSVASPTAQAFNLFSSNEVGDLAEGHNPVLFTNITSDSTVRAKVEVTAVQNMCSDESEVTGPNWELDWSIFQASTPSAVGYRVKYTFDDGAPIYEPAVGAFTPSTKTASLTGLTQTTDRSEYVFQVVEVDGSNDEVVGSSVTLSKSSSTRTNSAFHGDYQCEGGISRLKRLDKAGSDPSSTTHRLLEISTEKSDTSALAFTTIRISFEKVSDSAPVQFSSLSLNVYDLDNTQYVIFQNILNYQLTSDTNVASVTRNGTSWRFDSKDITTSGNDSYTKGRVQVNYENVSEVVVTLGLPVGEDSAGFDLDFSDGSQRAGEAWTPMSGPAPRSNELGTSSGGSGGVITPAVSLVSPLAPASVPGSRNVSLFGTNFDKVTEVYVGGKKLKIRKQSATQIDIRLPKGLSGLVDLELKSTLNNVLSPKHFNYGGVAGTATRKAELIVGGFAHNSRVLTARMQARIDRWLDKNSDLSTLTCTGFTSLPRRTTDVALSTNRGITACNFSKRQRSELETSVSQGVEDPRPGSNVRRVRLVLTP
jgi:hypothetical protein